MGTHSYSVTAVNGIWAGKYGGWATYCHAGSRHILIEVSLAHRIGVGFTETLAMAASPYALRRYVIMKTRSGRH